MVRKLESSGHKITTWEITEGHENAACNLGVDWSDTDYEDFNFRGGQGEASGDQRGPCWWDGT